MMKLALFPLWLHDLQIYTSTKGFPGGLRLSRVCLQHGRTGFNPWVGKVPWRRAWQPSLVFLLRESRGQRTMVRYSPWGRQESDTTERLPQRALFAFTSRRPRGL